MKKQKRKVILEESEPSEEVLISIPQTGIVVNLKSSKESLHELTRLGIETANSLMRFDRKLKSKKLPLGVG